jgi:adenylosuccinate synthase
MKKISITLGAGFGDESKGSFVNYLCSKADNPLVIRFSGGHQVGHTVVVGDKRHVFSNFGSGSLLDVPTYWSEYCTVDPIGVFKEQKALNAIGIAPKLYFNANAMVTTPFDKWQNMTIEKDNAHGSVGVGFGTTVQRNEDHYHLYIRDLLYPNIRDIKLKLIQENYYKYIERYKLIKEEVDKFKSACTHLIDTYEIFNNFDEIRNYYNSYIFEGSQGIMLDQDYGFFPNVTRSYTTSRNAIEFINKYDLHNGNSNYIDTYYVTRAYQTRHGNGAMTNEDLDISYIKENPLETNVSTGFQGKFRKSVLDLDLLKYTMDCDKYHNSYSHKNLVISCLDQVPDEIPVTQNSKLETLKYNFIAHRLGFSNPDSIFPCYSDTGYK